MKIRRYHLQNESRDKLNLNFKQSGLTAVLFFRKFTFQISHSVIK
jgi:hypothetical protein